jgi:hypothetical protein
MNSEITGILFYNDHGMLLGKDFVFSSSNFKAIH